MNIRSHTEIDTLYIEFRDAPVADTRDFDGSMSHDDDGDGKIRAIKVEHASKRAGIPRFYPERSPILR